MLAQVISGVCLFWYVGIHLVCALGYFQIYRNYRRRPLPAASETLPHNEIPVITVIRPVKGLEPNLYECLASTFQQTYPSDKLNIRICVPSRNDPAYPILQKLVAQYSNFDVKVLVEDEDPVLQSGASRLLGPNPKIRNMSRAYREARGDLIWIIDCNVWVSKGVAGRMVDKLCGYSNRGRKIRYKFVHQLPVVVDVTYGGFDTSIKSKRHANGHDHASISSSNISSSGAILSKRPSLLDSYSEATSFGGSRLEEMFLSSAHAKWYTAINTVLIAPCIVGKSTMFRKSHLDHLTSHGDEGRPSGIDYFSFNICEDHLIGDLLWKHKVSEELGTEPERLGKHAMVFGDLAIQPMAGMSVKEYIARRVRWLRVRKFTVTLATLVEPGTECFLSSAYGAWALTTIPWFADSLSIPPTWFAFLVVWVSTVIFWIFVDWTLNPIMQNMGSVEVDKNTPGFARTRSSRRRPFVEWITAWFGRECLTLPIWLWAVYGGVTVVWRGKRFRVGMDMRVHELDTPSNMWLDGDANNQSMNGVSNRKHD